MNKFFAAAALSTILSSAALAGQPVVSFQFEGDNWVVTNSGDGAPITGIHMTHGFAQWCPNHAIKLEATKKGPGLTKEEKFRGDIQWHVACDRTYVAQQDSPPARVAPPSGTGTDRYPPGGILQANDTRGM